MDGSKKDCNRDTCPGFKKANKETNDDKENENEQRQQQQQQQQQPQAKKRCNYDVCPSMKTDGSAQQMNAEPSTETATCASYKDEHGKPCCGRCPRPYQEQARGQPMQADASVRAQSMQTDLSQMSGDVPKNSTQILFYDSTFMDAPSTTEKQSQSQVNTDRDNTSVEQPWHSNLVPPTVISQAPVSSSPCKYCTKQQQERSGDSSESHLVCGMQNITIYSNPNQPSCQSSEPYGAQDMVCGFDNMQQFKAPSHCSQDTQYSNIQSFSQAPFTTCKSERYNKPINYPSNYRTRCNQGASQQIARTKEKVFPYTSSYNLQNPPPGRFPLHPDLKPAREPFTYKPSCRSCSSRFSRPGTPVLKSADSAFGTPFLTPYTHRPTEYHNAEDDEEFFSLSSGSSDEGAGGKRRCSKKRTDPNVCGAMRAKSKTSFKSLQPLCSEAPKADKKRDVAVVQLLHEIFHLLQNGGNSDSHTEDCGADCSGTLALANQRGARSFGPLSSHNSRADVAPYGSSVKITFTAPPPKTDTAIFYSAHDQSYSEFSPSNKHSVATYGSEDPDRNREQPTISQSPYNQPQRMEFQQPQQYAQAPPAVANCCAPQMNSFSQAYTPPGYPQPGMPQDMYNPHLPPGLPPGEQVQGYPPNQPGPQPYGQPGQHGMQPHGYGQQPFGQPNQSGMQLYRQVSQPGPLPYGQASQLGQLPYGQPDQQGNPPRQYSQHNQQGLQPVGYPQPDQQRQNQPNQQGPQQQGYPPSVFPQASQGFPQSGFSQGPQGQQGYTQPGMLQPAPQGQQDYPQPGLPQPGLPQSDLPQPGLPQEQQQQGYPQSPQGIQQSPQISPRQTPENPLQLLFDQQSQEDEACPFIPKSLYPEQGPSPCQPTQKPAVQNPYQPRQRRSSNVCQTGEQQPQPMQTITIPAGFQGLPCNLIITPTVQCPLCVLHAPPNGPTQMIRIPALAGMTCAVPSSSTCQGEQSRKQPSSCIDSQDLTNVGIEVQSFENWPGSETVHYPDENACTCSIPNNESNVVCKPEFIEDAGGAPCGDIECIDETSQNNSKALVKVETVCTGPYEDDYQCADDCNLTTEEIMEVARERYPPTQNQNSICPCISAPCAPQYDEYTDTTRSEDQSQSGNTEYDDDDIVCDEGDEECFIEKAKRKERKRARFQQPESEDNEADVRKSKKKGGKCSCCHCRAEREMKKCSCDAVARPQTNQQALGSINCAELKFFIDSIILDLDAMENARRMKNNGVLLPPARPTTPARRSFPVTITDVQELGSSSLYVKWVIHDCCGIGGYEIYVDGYLSNRYFHCNHEAAVICDVDINKAHKIVLLAQPRLQESIDYSMSDRNSKYRNDKSLLCSPSDDFDDDEEDDSCACKPAKSPTQVWTPSVYLYDPSDRSEPPPIIGCSC